MQWHDYFMGMARAVALKSKDEQTKVGAVIVDKFNRIISTGYNGPPRLMDDSQIEFVRPMKYPFMIHAELNAILLAHCDLSFCRLYVTGFPCEHCLLVIQQTGIVEVVYGNQPINMNTESKLINHVTFGVKEYVDPSTLTEDDE